MDNKKQDNSDRQEHVPLKPSKSTNSYIDRALHRIWSRWTQSSKVKKANQKTA